MIVLPMLSAHLLPPRGEQMLVYKRQLGEALEEYTSITEAMAKSQAKYKWPEALAKRSFALFWPSRTVPKRMKSVRFAARYRGRWLLIDKFGFARLDGAPGTVDALELERIWRLKPPPYPPASFTGIVRLAVRNRTGKPITLQDPAKRFRLDVPPNAGAEKTPWESPFLVSSSGALVGQISGWPWTFYSRTRGIRVEMKIAEIAQTTQPKRAPKDTPSTLRNTPPPTYSLTVTVTENK